MPLLYNGGPNSRLREDLRSDAMTSLIKLMFYILYEGAQIL